MASRKSNQNTIVKRDIANRFCIITPDLLSGFLVPSECRAMPQGAVEISCSRKVDIDQSPSSSDSDGIRWTISMSAASSDKQLEKMDGLRAYIGVFLTDGSIRILGTPDFIPRLTVTPYAGAYAVSASVEALRALDL